MRGDHASSSSAGASPASAPRASSRAPTPTVLVDKHDYHTFQPLLYQLATGLLETTAVGHSLRDLVEDAGQRRRPPDER